MQLPEIQRKEYHNGLVVLTEHIPKSQRACVNVSIRVGSMNETKRLLGISHFSEHMLFKSNELQEAKEISYNLEIVGAATNACTGWSETNLFGECLSNATPIVLKVFSDMIKNTSFDQEELKTEKGVVLGEYYKYIDDASDYLFDY